ncbi:HRDC domain-containing protein [Lactococcus petauri]|uniref:HRDC domain-containing protein n=1 Tax=Lactococcus petauri TaxID=1940789 RepID=UPI001BCE21E6|nr:HRDC domain-containing protein [Lactococcus petauri]MBS4460128.1 HRDC domain-containing protein [Lactococcus petauri]
MQERDWTQEFEVFDLFDFNNYQADAQVIFKALAEFDRALSLSLLIALLQGRKTATILTFDLQRNSSFVSLAKLNKMEIKNLIYLLMNRGLLKMRRLSGGRFAFGLSGDGLAHLLNPKPLLAQPPEFSRADILRFEQELALFEQLRAWRSQATRRLREHYLGLQVFEVATNFILKRIAHECPHTMEDLGDYGLSEEVLKNYGKEILELIHEAD